MRLWIGFFVFGVLAVLTAADTPRNNKFVMTEPGKELLTDDLSGPLDKGWKQAKGKWEAHESATRGSEIKADMHGAVMRRNVEFQNAAIQYSFKLDGTNATTFSVNGAKGHVCRVRITPTGFSVHKDDTDGKTGPDKGEQLGLCTTPIEVGKWHTMHIEIHGKEIIAHMGDKFAYGKHEAINTKKTNVGLTVAGEFASFKNLKMWEATEAKDWDKTREKMLEKK